MRYFGYLGIGFLFGIVMIKSGAASWFRIYEMFRFESFHMYGIMGTAVLCGIVIVQLIKRFQLRNVHGQIIQLPGRWSWRPDYVTGGLIFGLGWGLAGACPGPMFTLVGAGYFPVLVLIGFGVIGTWLGEQLLARR